MYYAAMYYVAMYYVAMCNVTMCNVTGLFSDLLKWLNEFSAHGKLVPSLLTPGKPGKRALYM